ncbi:NlpC/P60 family protein [Streptomyces sp. NPDC096080]|uniref:C40 family peptidase n=1 Tax=Streptomyces sp. NPDC096080 TaxID=3156693 RepID=UPI00333298D0
MSGRLLRLVCTAAATACAVLAPLPAAAVPGPGLGVGVGLGVRLGPGPGAGPLPADAGTPSAGPDDPLPAPPQDALAPGAGDPAAPETDGLPGPAAAPDLANRSVAELLTELQKRYRTAEQATETYNGTAERLRRGRAEVARLDRELTRVRLSLRDSKGAAGRLARQQYQGTSGLSPYLRLLLARDPQQALDQGHVIGQVARERAEALGRLTGDERKADDLARKARKALDDQLALARRQQRDREDVRRGLRDVEALLAALTPQQLTELADAERRGVDREQRKLVTSGAVSTVRQPSDQGGRAVDYALRQLGKPYEWGAEGPGTYDCSGLTSKAWEHAGTPIPRTSEEQWARLRHIPLGELRPGDLVVYFPEATHVALYLGEGKVVQAPRTGEKVTVSPMAVHPILGAVRPDPAG